MSINNTVKYEINKMNLWVVFFKNNDGNNFTLEKGYVLSFENKKGFDKIKEIEKENFLMALSFKEVENAVLNYKQKNKQNCWIIFLQSKNGKIELDFSNQLSEKSALEEISIKRPDDFCVVLGNVKDLFELYDEMKLIIEKQIFKSVVSDYRGEIFGIRSSLVLLAHKKPEMKEKIFFMEKQKKQMVF